MKNKSKIIALALVSVLACGALAYRMNRSDSVQRAQAVHSIKDIKAEKAEVNEIIDEINLDSIFIQAKNS